MKELDAIQASKTALDTALAEINSLLKNFKKLDGDQVNKQLVGIQATMTAELKKIQDQLDSSVDTLADVSQYMTKLEDDFVDSWQKIRYSLGITS